MENEKVWHLAGLDDELANRTDYVAPWWWRKNVFLKIHHKNTGCEILVQNPDTLFHLVRRPCENEYYFCSVLVDSWRKRDFWSVFSLRWKKTVKKQNIKYTHAGYKLINKSKQGWFFSDLIQIRPERRWKLKICPNWKFLQHDWLSRFPRNYELHIIRILHDAEMKAMNSYFPYDGDVNIKVKLPSTWDCDSSY